MDINKGMGVPDIQKAYAILFGQGMWTICGSIVAFLVGQLIDVVIFHRILRVTGERFVWLRATASTAVSQLLDSFIVLYIAFVIGPQHWSIPQFLAIGTVNYVYKMCAAIALIPLLYVARIGYPRISRARRGGAAAARGRQRLATARLDHSRGLRQQRRRKREACFPGRIGIDGEPVPGGIGDRQVAGFAPFRIFAASLAAIRCCST